MEPTDPPSLPPARLPWDFHPALTEERLRLCARLLANARRDALAMAEGVKVHHSSIAALLKRLGFTYKKNRWWPPNSTAPV